MAHDQQSVAFPISLTAEDGEDAAPNERHGVNKRQTQVHRCGEVNNVHGEPEGAHTQVILPKVGAPVVVSIGNAVGEAGLDIRIGAEESLEGVEGGEVKERLADGEVECDLAKESLDTSLVPDLLTNRLVAKGLHGRKKVLKETHVDEPLADAKVGGSKENKEHVAAPVNMVVLLDTGLHNKISGRGLESGDGYLGFKRVGLDEGEDSPQTCGCANSASSRHSLGDVAEFAGFGLESLDAGGQP